MTARDVGQSLTVGWRSGGLERLGAAAMVTAVLIGFLTILAAL